MIPRWINGKDGSVSLNDLIRYVKGGFLVPEQSRTPLIIPAAVSATVPRSAPSLVIEAPSDSVAEIFSFVGEQDTGVGPDVAARMTCQITDVAFRRRLMNKHIPAQHIFGGAGVNGSGGVPGYFPLFLRESILLEQQQTMLFDFNNNSIAGPTAFRFMLEQRKFQSTSLTRDLVTNYIKNQRFRKTLLQPYFIGQDGDVNLPVGQQGLLTFTNTRPSYFIWLGTAATFIVNGAGGGNLVEGFAVTMFDAKTQRPLQNQPVVRSCCTGSAGLPYQNPTGLILEPDTRMQWQVQNLVTGGGTSIDIFVTLIGALSYTLENPFETPMRGVQVADPSAASYGAP